MGSRWGRHRIHWDLPVMASDWLGGDNNGASTENEGPTVAMSVLRAASPFPLGRRDSPTPTGTCCPTSPNPSFQPLTATRILQPKAIAWQTQLPELSESMAFLPLLQFRKQREGLPAVPNNLRSHGGSKELGTDSGPRGKRLQLTPKLFLGIWG